MSKREVEIIDRQRETIAGLRIELYELKVALRALDGVNARFVEKLRTETRRVKMKVKNLEDEIDVFYETPETKS